MRTAGNSSFAMVMGVIDALSTTSVKHSGWKKSLPCVDMHAQTRVVRCGVVRCGARVHVHLSMCVIVCIRM